VEFVPGVGFEPT